MICQLGKVNASPRGNNQSIIALCSGAVALIIFNLVSTQPLIGPISTAIGLRGEAIGLISMATMLGYAAGLFLLVPLVDLIENRRLICQMLVGNSLSLFLVAGAPSAPIFLVAALLAGATASVIQMLVPLAAFLSPAAHRGRVVGNVTSCMMLGLLFSRPVAGIVDELVGWRVFFAVLAILIGSLALVLNRLLPERHPEVDANYLGLLRSLGSLLAEEPVLRRRSLSGFFVAAAFNTFWTVVALKLSSAPFALNPHQIALFAFAGAGGAIAAPIAGRLGDRGWTREATWAAHLCVIAAMLMAGLVLRAGPGTSGLFLILLVFAALVLDTGVIGDQTLGRRAVNLVRPESRGRMNGIFTGIFFLGFSLGSFVSGFAWTHGGWGSISLSGAAFGAIALSISLTAPRQGDSVKRQARDPDTFHSKADSLESRVPQASRPG